MIIQEELKYDFRLSDDNKKVLFVAILNDEEVFVFDSEENKVLLSKGDFSNINFFDIRFYDKQTQNFIDYILDRLDRDSLFFPKISLKEYYDLQKFKHNIYYSHSIKLNISIDKIPFYRK